MNKINTTNARNKLAVRNEPYWISLSTGRAIGYRKTVNGGNWQAKYINSQGKRFKQSLGSDLTYADALGKCNLWFDEMDHSTTGGKPTTFTVADACKKYLNYLEEHKAKTTFYRTSSNINKHILPALGEIELNKLTTLMIAEWQSGLLVKDKGEEKLRQSKDSANRTLANLKALLNMAFKLGMTPTNVEWLKVDKYKNAAQPRSVFLDKEQLANLIGVCDGNFKQLVQAGIYTGARLGEITGAKTSDFNPSKGCLHVTGKTGHRDIYLTPMGIEFFSGLCADREGFLLVNDDGEQWGERDHAHLFRKAVKVAELPLKTCFYTLRHSYISLALKRGINIHLLAKNCGNSAEIIEKNYGKFLPSDIRAAFLNGEF